MTAIALLVEAGATPSSVTATLDIFNVASRFPGGEGCRVDMLSSGGGPVALNASVSVETRPISADLADYDALIVPGFFAADLAALDVQLRTTWAPVAACLAGQCGGALVAASCHGTFVLAESGRLDGHTATTPWWFQCQFAERYPKVRLLPDPAWVDDGKVVTAGAMTAHTELSMHVLRRLRGPELARNVASIMLLDEARTSQRPFVLLPRHFPDPLVQRAADRLAADPSGQFCAERLAAACHVSYRTLHRRFTAAAGMAPLEYLQALRVERAKSLLENSRQSIDAIVAEVGYADVASFRRLFLRLAGMTPAQYRRRFRRGEPDGALRHGAAGAALGPG